MNVDHTDSAVDENGVVTVANRGAVYLYAGHDGRLIATITGAMANDEVGRDGVVKLSNGNFVIVSSHWDYNHTENVGAVTLVDGNTGQIIGGSGGHVVSATNSLHGTAANDQIGTEFVKTDQGFHQANRAGDVLALGNGNFVVGSPFWDNGNVADAGAVTLVSGTTGRAVIDGSLTVSKDNSLHGSSAQDSVGQTTMGQLWGLVSNTYNYVVSSPFWNDGNVANAGAVTLVSGTTGRAVIDSSLTVSKNNSLHGSSTEDQVGSTRPTALSNGNFVVRSFYWGRGSADDDLRGYGAVTVGDGLTGRPVIGGVLSVTRENSIAGTVQSDQISRQGILPIPDTGNFVISSPYWNQNAGAMTLVSGTTGRAVIDGSLTVSKDNSLHSTTPDAYLSWFNLMLLDHNIVVGGADGWKNPDTNTENVGAVITMNGLSGRSAVDATLAISANNSLHGTTKDDQVGTGCIFFSRCPQEVRPPGLVRVQGGHFLVLSPYWDNDNSADVGAVTLVDATTGKAGGSSEVTTNNSVVGRAASDGSFMGRPIYDPNNDNFTIRFQSDSGGGSGYFFLVKL